MNLDRNVGHPRRDGESANAHTSATSMVFRIDDRTITDELEEYPPGSRASRVDMRISARERLSSSR
jgi:hypothetical protein